MATTQSKVIMAGWLHRQHQEPDQGPDL